MVLGVMLARLGAMVRRMLGMPMRAVRVMSRLLVIACLVVLGGFAMVLCCVLVMFRGTGVMIGPFVRSHSASLSGLALVDPNMPSLPEIWRANSKRQSPLPREERKSIRGEAGAAASAQR
jgi:hypothetical protein